MNKKKILPLIILDIILIAAASTVMIQRYHALTEVVLLTPPPSVPFVPEPAPEQTAPAPLPVVSSAPAATATPELQPPPQVQKKEQPRNIRFILYNARAKRVSITGEFTGWKRELLKRGKGHKWTINIPIEPGTYAYNFVIDGKLVKDPNNPHSCNSGRGFLSSSLSVEQLSHGKQQPH